MISKIALDKDTRKAVMAIVTKQAEIDWKDLATYSGIGAVGSGLTGGLVSHLSSDEKDPKKKMQNTLHDMLTSGVLGGAAGAGAYGMQSLIPGLGTPAETLHGPKAGHPPQTLGSTVANSSAVLPSVMGAKGAFHDIARNTHANKMDTKFTGILGSGTDDFNAKMNDPATAQDTHANFVNERAGGIDTHQYSRSAATANMFDNLHKAGITNAALKEAAKQRALDPNWQPVMPAGASPQTKAYFEDFMKSMGLAEAGTKYNANSAERRGLNPMNHVDNFFAKYVAPHSSTAARIGGSSTVRNLAPSLGVSLVANALWNQADKSNPVQQ